MRRARLMRTVISMLIGFGIGVLCGKWLWRVPSTEPTQSATTRQPMVAATATPAPIAPSAAEADGVVYGTKDMPLPYNQPYDLVLQVDGHETPVECSVSVVDYLLPEFYEMNYGDAYKLLGTEADAVISITASASIDVNDYLTFGLEAISGQEVEGYPLMDAAISGEYRSWVDANVSTTRYKRFQYDTGKEARYLTLLYPAQGQTVKVYFWLGRESEAALDSDGAAATMSASYEVLERGDMGDAVQRLQERLIELGYPVGNADGLYGAMTTEAVRRAQQAMDMEPTGIADAVFQRQLYEGDMP